MRQVLWQWLESKGIETDTVLLQDGVYDLQDLSVERIPAEITPDNEKEAEDILQHYRANPFRIGGAYETYKAYIIGGVPTNITDKFPDFQGNYGITAVLDGCPSRILILQEND